MERYEQVEKSNDAEELIQKAKEIVDADDMPVVNYGQNKPALEALETLMHYFNG